MTRALDRGARREQILSAASRLFAERGYHATQVSDIIAAAGIARGTFYLYFESKRAIFEELLDVLIVRLTRCIKTVDVADGAPPPEEQILDNLVRVFSLFEAERHLLSLLLEGAVGQDKGFDDKLAEFYGRVTEIIEVSLRRGQEMGIVRPCDARIAALAVLGATKEILNALVRPANAAPDVRALVSEILDVFSRGVLAVERPGV